MNGLDVKELTLFLRKNMSTQGIRNSTFEKCIPIKLKKPKRKVKGESQEDLWKFSDHNPTSSQIKSMWAEAVAILVRMAMNNHIFIFGNEIRIQSGDGSIGVRLTGILAELIMLIWCKLLKNKLSNAGIVNELLSRFVDDITMVQEIIPEGMRLQDDKLVMNVNKISEDSNIPGDIRTMNIIKEIADGIDSDIEVTFDTQSKNADGFVPILDLKACITDENKIMYIFYRKPITSNFVTLKSAAMTMRQKMDILTQQCFSRLHNTSREAEESVKVNILNEFMRDLQMSGYNEQDRLKVLEGGINTYKNISEKETKGLRPFYRPGSFQKEQRAKDKANKKLNWFNGKKCDQRFKTVMYIDATPGDVPLKMMRATEERHKVSDDIRVKLV